MQTTPSTNSKAKRLRRMQRLTGVALTLVASMPLFNWGVATLGQGTAVKP